MLARSYTVLGRFARGDARLRPRRRAAAEQRRRSSPTTPTPSRRPSRPRTTRDSLALIERALKADPKHSKALALAGSAAFDRGDYAVAIAHWQKIADQLPPDSELAPQRAGDDRRCAREARARAGAAPPPRRRRRPPRRAPPASAAKRAGRHQRQRHGDARPGAGGAGGARRLGLRLRPRRQRQPHAARGPARPGRRTCRSRFRLDDSMAMAPGMTLSSAPQLIVGARISKSGNAIAQPGDLAGEAHRRGAGREQRRDPHRHGRRQP